VARLTSAHQGDRPCGSTTGTPRSSHRRRARGPAPHQCFRSPSWRRREARLVDPRLFAVLECHHQLDPLERAQAELFQRRGAAERAARARIARAPPRPCRLGRGGRVGARPPPTRESPRASASACPPCAAARPPATPTRRGCAGDPAAARWPGGTWRPGRCPASSTSTRARAPPPVPATWPDDRRLAHAGTAVEHPLDVLGEHVEPLGRDDHLLLAALDEQPPLRVALADVAGVQPALRVDGAVRWRSAPKYPLVTFSPRTRISPSSAMRTSTPAMGVPTEPLLVLNG
jgi:hypothetical protein